MSPSSSTPRPEIQAALRVVNEPPDVQMLLRRAAALVERQRALVRRRRELIAQQRALLDQRSRELASFADLHAQAHGPSGWLRHGATRGTTPRAVRILQATDC